MFEVLGLGKAAAVDSRSNMTEVYYDAGCRCRWTCFVLVASFLRVITARRLGGCYQVAMAMDDFFLRLGVHLLMRVSDGNAEQELEVEGR